MGLSVIAGVAALATLGLGADALAHGFFGPGSGGDGRPRFGPAGAAGVHGVRRHAGSAAAGLLRGRKDTRAPMLFSLVGNWAVGAPVGIYLCEVEAMGITGIWIGLLGGMIVTTLLTLARVVQTSVSWRPSIA